MHQPKLVVPKLADFVNRIHIFVVRKNYEIFYKHIINYQSIKLNTFDELR